MIIYNLKKFSRNRFFVNSGDILIFSNGFVRLEKSSNLQFGLAFGAITFEDLLKPNFIKDFLGNSEVIIVIMNGLRPTRLDLSADSEIKEHYYKDYVCTINAKRWTIWPLKPPEEVPSVIESEQAYNKAIYNAFSYFETRKSKRFLVELDCKHPKLLEISDLCFKMKFERPFSFYLQIREEKYEFVDKVERVIAALILIQIDPELAIKLVPCYSDIAEFANLRNVDVVDSMVKLTTVMLAWYGPESSNFGNAISGKALVLDKIPVNNGLRGELIKGVRDSMYFPQVIQHYLSDMDYFEVLLKSLGFKVLISLLRHYLILLQSNHEVVYVAALKVIWLLKLSITRVNAEYLRELKATFPDSAAFMTWSLLVDYCGRKTYERLIRRGLPRQLKFQNMSQFKIFECSREGGDE